MGIIAGFRILRVIGRGAMGTVYEAYDESMHRRVALKVLDAGLSTSEHAVARFEREAWIGGRLSHPNIVQVHAQGSDADRHYFVMELLEGGSLHSEIRVARRQRDQLGVGPTWWNMRIRRVVELFAGTASGLEYVHGQGIIHRDIKPLNLLLNKGAERLLLSDFGVARDRDASRLTRRGDFLGTVAYMSPEQLLAHRAELDHRSDLWSLGVSLYEAVTLELPYEAATEEAYIRAVSTKEPTRARIRNHCIAKDLETILMKCLERDPDRRYDSGANLRADLSRFLQDMPVAARRPGPLSRVMRSARRSRRSIAMTVLVSGAVAVGTIGTVMWIDDQRELYRIGWTLRQSIRRGLSPEDLQPDWRRLQDRLQGIILRDPDGPLSRLARGAACRARAQVPNLGLTSRLQDMGVGIEYGSARDLGISYLCIADAEACWDGGAWQPIHSSLYGTGNGLKAWMPLSDFLSPAQVTADRHRIDLRVTFSLYDSRKIEKPRARAISAVRRGFDRLFPEIRMIPRLFHETRLLGEFPVVLFEQLPSSPTMSREVP